MTFRGTARIIDRMKRLALICSILLTVAVLGCGGGSSSNPVTPIRSPQITSIYPQSGGPGTEVMIRGAYFGAAQANSYISYNGDPCVFSYWNDTYITCTIPSTAHYSGSFVVTAAGVVSAPSMQFSMNAPQITSVSPSGGPAGTLITISGTGFGVKTDNSRVSFNGYNAIIESWANTLITCRVPTGPQNGTISLNVYLTSDYYVTTNFAYALPVITSILSVNSSSTGNNVGAELAINGQGFGSYQSEYNGTLTFGSTQVYPISWSPSRVTFRIPSGISEGTYGVTLSLNGKTVSSSWTVYKPVISLSNSSTSYGQGDLIALTGNYLGSGDQTSHLVQIADPGDPEGTADYTVTNFSSWSDTGISFINPVSGTLIGTTNKTITVVVGGLRSYSVTVKTK